MIGFPKNCLAFAIFAVLFSEITAQNFVVFCPSLGFRSNVVFSSPLQPSFVHSVHCVSSFLNSRALLFGAVCRLPTCMFYPCLVLPGVAGDVLCVYRGTPLTLRQFLATYNRDYVMGGFGLNVHVDARLIDSLKGRRSFFLQKEDVARKTTYENHARPGECIFSEVVHVTQMHMWKFCTTCFSKNCPDSCESTITIRISPRVGLRPWKAPPPKVKNESMAHHTRRCWRATSTTISLRIAAGCRVLGGRGFWVVFASVWCLSAGCGLQNCSNERMMDDAAGHKVKC